MRLLGPKEIKEIRTQRKDLEVRVGRSIGKCIKDCCQQDLREMIRVLLREICQIPMATLNKFLAKKYTAYAMFVSGAVTPTRPGLAFLCSRSDSLDDLSICSDIIRLFGELSEEEACKNLTGSRWAQHEARKNLLKPEPTYLKPEDSRDKGWVPFVGPLRPSDSEHLYGHRRRDDLEKMKLPITRSEAPYDPIPNQIKRGVDKFRFGDQSVIGAIDRTFGAEPTGADVSGTTTDSIYAVKYAVLGSAFDPEHMYAFKHAPKGSPFDKHLHLLMLLPVATMVPAGHHSLIECAYPLSRWSYIDYHIGYYDTLVPTNCTGKDGEALGKALAAFPAEANKLHALVYRNKMGQEVGLLMEGDHEIGLFKPLARLRSAYGWCVAGGLNWDLLQNVMNIYCKDLLSSYPGHLRSRAKTQASV
jgi:hypothetical protein